GIAHLHLAAGGGDRAGGDDTLQKLRFARAERDSLAQDYTQAEAGMPLDGGHPGIIRRRLGFQLAGGDGVFEIVRVQAVEALLAGLRLGIHQEAYRRTTRAGKLHVVRVVVREPVHLPGAEELRSHRRYHGIGERGRLRLLLEHDFSHIGGVDRHPAIADQEHLGAAVLRAGDVGAADAEAAVAEVALGDAQAVDVARRHVHRACKADIERVEICALARQVAGLEHRLDVADTAAARLRIALRVVDDPVVDGARFFDVGALAASDFVDGLAHDTVGDDQLGRRGGELGGRGIDLDRGIALAEVGRPVEGGEGAHHLEHRRFFRRVPFGYHHRGTVSAVASEAGRAVARPIAADYLLVVALHRGHGYPGARHSFGFQDLDPSGHLEGAPARR